MFSVKILKTTDFGCLNNLNCKWPLATKVIFIDFKEDTSIYNPNEPEITF